MSYGRYYEEFTVGDIYRHWPGRTITEHDDTWFSLMTMNQHPLHIDAHYAAGTEHGKRLVNGTFIFSLAVGMSVADVSGKCIANLEYESVRHLGPSFHGDTIYAVTEVLEKRESTGKPDRGIVYVETRAHNQHGEEVLVFRRRVLVPKRPVDTGRG